MEGLPLYHLYEMQHAAMGPYRAAADATRLLWQNPVNPLANTLWGKSVIAGCEMFERVTRRYGKPEWGIEHTVIDDEEVSVTPEIVWELPFCNLVRFARATEEPRHDPKVLIVAPMSGHYATLLRGTVQAFLPGHDVYITDWIDARMVPADEGRFDLDDYIDYVIAMFHRIGEGTHVIGVCQPSVPVLAAVSLMEARKDPYAPRSMTLMGGPIDTRSNPTAVNRLAEEKGLDWFQRHVIVTVPFPNPGMGRQVYPGFLQLGGFMSMNLDRHIGAHREMFAHLVHGDGDSAHKHREFYDEYLSVMDLTAEFYLQTVDTVFVRHALPKGEMTHRGTPIDPGKIRNTALLTIEGEHDDISGLGQTEAAHRLCTGIPAANKVHYVQRDVGHYGVFNGSRFRRDIAPKIAHFIREHELARSVTPSTRKNGHPSNGQANGRLLNGKGASDAQQAAALIEAVA
jgi:poly(3-hydroxybutyrate) depolymerase